MHDMVEVTSNNRPDTTWKFVDVAGHEHMWWEGSKPAVGYSPMKRYSLLTLKYVVDAEGDDEYPATGHYECVQCGEHVIPGRCPDSERQFIPGLRR